MRIAQIILHDGHGGMETLVQALDSEFNQRGHEASVLALDESGYGDDRLRRLTRLWRRLRETNPEVVISHSAIPNVYARVANPLGVPLISVLHSSADDFESARMRWSEIILRARTRHIIAVSKIAASRYTERFPRRGAKIIIVPNGIAWPPRTEPQSSRGVDDLRAVCVGRMVRGKAVHDLIEAIAQPSFPQQMTVDVIGPATDPEYAEVCQALIKELDLSSRVRLLGARENVPDLLPSYDLLIHPSVSESQGLAVLEAAAVGVPAVTTTAISDALDDHIVRTEAEPSNPVSLARACAEAVATLDVLTRRARECVPRLQETYSVERTADVYLSLAASERA